MVGLKIDLEEEKITRCIEEGITRAIKPYVKIGFIFGGIYFILTILKLVI